MSQSESPATGPYRIQAVAELTGVAETTLRAWERRYGIPSPERTAAGYRLYGPREVAQVREMLRLCEDEGLAPAEAARIVTGQGAPDNEAPAKTIAEDEVWTSTVDSLVSAIERFDDAALDDALRRLLLLGHSNLIVDRVITPTLQQVGQKWHQGSITVAQEHMASHRINTFLRGLLQVTASADDDPRVVLGAFADDTHEIGLLATALRVSSWGLRPVFLGARTPPGAIRNTVEALSPRLVALSVTITPERGRARELVDDYATACGDVPWIVGGIGVEPIADLIIARKGRIAPPGRVEQRALVMELIAKAPSNRRKT